MLDFSNIPHATAQAVLGFLNTAQAPDDIIEQGYGIGKDLFQRILDERARLPGGRFTDLSQLEHVQGFGQDNLNDLVFLIIQKVTGGDDTESTRSPSHPSAPEPPSATGDTSEDVEEHLTEPLPESKRTTRGDASGIDAGPVFEIKQDVDRTGGMIGLGGSDFGVGDDDGMIDDLLGATRGDDPLFEEDVSLKPQEPAADPVRLATAAPQAVRPGDEFTARLAFYAPDEEAQIAETLKALNPDDEPQLGLRDYRWRRGTGVTVQLASRHLEIDTPEQTFVWEGKGVLLDFGVYVPDGSPNRRTSLTFRLFIEGLAATRPIRLDVEITDTPATQEPVVTVTEPPDSAFASYASEDRQRVLDRVAAIRIATGLDIFTDCLSLKPGDRWKEALREEIESRDLFYLFWSEHAKDSPWVTWEWQTALQAKGLDAIQPQPLVPPTDAPPPDALGDLHFNDIYILVRESLKPPRT